jgi:hypothetical protein
LGNLSSDSAPAYASGFVFAYFADRLAHLRIENSEGHQEKLLHPHAAFDVVYLSSFNTGDF